MVTETFKWETSIENYGLSHWKQQNITMEKSLPVFYGNFWDKESKEIRVNKPECECLPGWAGPGCATPTPPVALGAASYVKVALSFTPSPWSVGVQLRVRTHGARDGLLLLLAAHPATRPHAADIQSLGQGLSRRLSWIPDGFPSVSPRSPPGVLKAFLWLLKRPTDITDKIVREASLPTLSLVPLTPTAARGRGVRVCSGAGVGGAAAEACVDGRPLGDGEWHTVSAERHAHNLLVGVDDGDAWRSNASLITLEEAEGGPGRRRPPALDVDKQEGVVVGGLPVFEEAGLVSVRADLREACVADIRVCGRPLPVPPASNSSTWGQVTMAEGVHGDCAAVDACANTTCAAPLTCATTWGKPTCSCGPGQHLAERTCIDIDECTWGPCLHGGTCYNTQPGFTCECAPAYTGQHCQWALADRQTDVLAAPAAIVGLTVSCLVLVVLCLLLSLRCRRLLTSRLLQKRREAAARAAKGGGGGGGAACKARVISDITGEALADEGGTAMGVLSCEEASGEEGWAGGGEGEWAEEGQRGGEGGEPPQQGVRTGEVSAPARHAGRERSTIDLPYIRGQSRRSRRGHHDPGDHLFASPGPDGAEARPPGAQRRPSRLCLRGGRVVFGLAHLHHLPSAFAWKTLTRATSGPLSPSSSK
nr:uncharacterized protein LOC113817760 [Penaeus vannamei]